MLNNTPDTDLTQISMQVIIHAGNAREKASQAMDLIENFEFEKAIEILNCAEEDITTAHNIQTDLIQSEACGTKHEFSLLMTHAQDTLMSAKSELQITFKLLKIFKHFYQEMNK